MTRYHSINSATLCMLVVLAITLIGSRPVHAKDNELTDAEIAEGWVSLFNGSDLKGWKNNNDKPVEAKIEDGSINPHGTGGYLLVYDKRYGDFVFQCDVKMSGPDCNSGVFLRCGDLEDPIYSSLEIQVLGGDGATMHDFGSIYDLVAPSKNATRGDGEWDTIEARCEGPLVTVSVNGEQVAEMNVDEWKEPGKRLDGTRHKFRKAIKDFPREGYIGLQDHGHDVWFKNIKVREL